MPASRKNSQATCMQPAVRKLRITVLRYSKIFLRSRKVFSYFVIQFFQ